METDLLKLPICPSCKDTKYVTDRWCRPFADHHYHICYKCCINWSPHLGVRKDDWLMEMKHKTIADSAYAKWIADHKPYGRDQEFWLEAEREYYSHLNCVNRQNDVVLL